MRTIDPNEVAKMDDYSVAVFCAVIWGIHAQFYGASYIAAKQKGGFDGIAGIFFILFSIACAAAASVI